MTSLKSAMLKFAPVLEQDYKRFVRETFARMQADLGPELKGVYNSRKWARTFSTIRQNITTERAVLSGSMYEIDKTPKVINEIALEKNARRYGEEVSLQWYGKMVVKLGDLKEVTVSDPNAGGYITIRGKSNEDRVVVEQQRIINVSSLGTLFHQFPARIYVNGKSVSEAEYKGLPKGSRLPTLTTKRPVIDPNSRPKEYEFQFKVEYIGTPELPHNYGWIDTRQEHAKGMSEEEAWKKIEKQEMRDGYYKRVFDRELLAIWAWNGIPLWKKPK